MSAQFHDAIVLIDLGDQRQWRSGELRAGWIVTSQAKGNSRTSRVTSCSDGGANFTADEFIGMHFQSRRSD